MCTITLVPPRSLLSQSHTVVFSERASISWRQVARSGRKFLQSDDGHELVFERITRTAGVLGRCWVEAHLGPLGPPEGLQRHHQALDEHLSTHLVPDPRGS